jgi:hypothetical protein
MLPAFLSAEYQSSHPEIDGENFKVTWATFTDGVKSALKFVSFDQLCNDSGHELERLEIGYLIAEFCDRDAQNVMDSIGHPIEAWNAANL